MPALARMLGLVEADDPAFEGPGDCRGAVVHTELGVDVHQVGLGGGRADKQLLAEVTPTERL